MELQLNNDLLQTQCQLFNFDDPQVDPVDLSNSMTLFREKNGGVGLAANQVGLDLAVINIKGIDGCLFNPRIVYKSDVTDTMEEGCLSFPGLAVKIKRSKMVRLRWTDAFGQTKTQQFGGYSARVIQHEIDHINGILFYNRAHQYHRSRAMKKWRKQGGHKIQRTTVPASMDTSALGIPSIQGNHPFVISPTTAPNLY